VPTPEWLIPTLRAMPEVSWSICVRDGAGAPLLSWQPDAVLPTASVGKVLLLAEVARRLEDGELDAADLLPRDPELWVGDSGLWQHLTAGLLPVADLATLVGAVSDNLATNVLLARVGPDAARRPATGLGLVATGLHDRLRDLRDAAAGHPPTLSTGTAAELTALLHALNTGALPGGARVLGWLRLNTDLSMVASAFGLDPLAHAAPDLGLLLANKTGTDAGIRADIGVVVPAPDGEPDPARALGYAALAHWAPDLEPDHERRTRLAVLAVMRRLGEHLDEAVRAARGSGAAG
jgi:beta-lactamase class A